MLSRLCRKAAMACTPRDALPLVAVIALGLLPARTAAQTTTEPRRAWLHVDSRFFHADSDEAVQGFGIDLMQVGPRVGGVLVGAPGDGDAGPSPLPESRWRSRSRDILSFALSTFLGSAFEHAAHEYGHATRLAAAGFDPRVAHRSWGSAEEIAAGVRAGEGTNDFFRYFLTSLSDRSGSTVATTERVRRPVDLDAWSDRWEAAAVVGGLNAEMAFTLRLAEDIDEGRGHAGMLSTYLNGKLAARQYGTGAGSLNDMTNILDWYERRGLDIDQDRIRRGSARAALLSAGTYRLAWAVGSMLAGRGARAPARSAGPVLLPETGFHLGPSGIGHSVHSGARWGRWTGRVSYEWAATGAAQREVGLGAAGRHGRLTGDLRVRVGAGLGGRLALRWRLRDRMAVEALAARYDPANLFGARHTTRIDGGRADWVGAVRVGWSW